MSKVIGIDLGTTNSCVAVMDGGKPKVVENSEGARTTPSIVAFTKDSERLIGQPAKRQAVTNPDNTLFAIKRLIGRRFDDPLTKKDMELVPYDIVKGKNGDAWVEAGGEDYSPSQISAFILQKMKETAESYLGETVTQAVITVPAYFNDAQRQATKDAGQIAGLEVLRIINEPTAAALAYGMDKEDGKTIAVYDLGGGTFDVSLLSLQRGVFEVLATGGDTNLGGDDFDRVLCDWLMQVSSHSGTLSHSKRIELLYLANQIRHQLSDEESVDVSYGAWTGKLDAELFTELTQDLVNRTINTCRRVLRDARLTVDAIDNIVLVGGATRMPVIRNAVAEFFGKSPLVNIDPDKVVAIGAGIQADVLIGNKSEDNFLLLDVNPLSLGIETMGELVEKIIPRNTTIPVAKAQEFTTFKDGQTVMSLHVGQGERELVSDCRSLARFELRGIPPMVAGAAKIRVTFQVDADGLLSVTAQELSTNTKSEIQIKPSYGLNADAIEKMLESSRDHAQADMESRALKEAQLEATQLIDALANASKVDGELLSAEEASRMADVVARLQSAISDGSSNQIHALSEELNQVSGDFAARRMDLTIGEALRGHSIDEIERSTDE